MSKTRRYSTSDRINDIVKDLIKKGWSLIQGSRHARLRSPDGKVTVTVPKTPSDHRAALNWISQCRNSGVPI